MRGRIGPNLELDDLRQCSIAGLAVEWHAVAIGRSDGAALPAGIRVIDAAIDVLGEEAKPIRHSHVVAKARRVELIDPGVVARLGAAGNYGPGNGVSVQPSGQSFPSAACGPLSGPLHLRPSNAPR